MPFASLIGPALGLGASLLGGDGGASQAGGIAQGAANANNQLLGGLWGQQQGWLQPYMNAGQSGLTGYQNFLNGDQKGLDAYKASTGFKTNLQAGTDGLASQAATRGLLHSGGSGKALAKYGVDLNQQYGQNYLNNLAQQVGWGQNATNTGVQAAAHYGDAVGANNIYGADARANAALARGSSFQNMLGQGAGLLGSALSFI